MERFADSLGIGKFGQVGVSGGGPYVLACAARIPDRLTGSAVLGGAVPLAGLAAGRKGLHPAYRMLIPFRKLPGAVFAPMFKAASLASRWDPARPPMSWAVGSLANEDRRVLVEFPEVWSLVTRSYQEGAETGSGRGFMADADIYFQPLQFDLSAIRHPIRFWHGADDRNIPLHMVREFVSKIAGATLEVDEALGHFSLVIRKAPAALDYVASRAAEAGD